MAGNKYRVNLDSSIYSFVYLYNAADFLLDSAEEKEEGRFYNCMGANLMLAFCIEAYLNHVCEDLLPYWNEDVKKDLRTFTKLHMVESLLKKNPDYSKRPYQSLKDILKFRSLIVHSKTEKFKEEKVQYIENNQFPKHARLWWEKKCTLKVTKNWFEDTKTVIIDLHKAQGKKGNPFLVMSMHEFAAKPL